MRSSCRWTCLASLRVSRWYRGMIEVSGVNKTFYPGRQRRARTGQHQPAHRTGRLPVGNGPLRLGQIHPAEHARPAGPPDAGSYLLNGVDTMSLDENERARLRREQIGFVFQSYHLIPRLTARENMELPLMLAGVAAKRRHAQVDDILDKLGIAAARASPAQPAVRRGAPARGHRSQHRHEAEHPAG